MKYLLKLTFSNPFILKTFILINIDKYKTIYIYIKKYIKIKIGKT